MDKSWMVDKSEMVEFIGEWIVNRRMKKRSHARMEERIDARTVRRADIRTKERSDVRNSLFNASRKKCFWLISNFKLNSGCFSPSAITILFLDEFRSSLFMLFPVLLLLFSAPPSALSSPSDHFYNTIVLYDTSGDVHSVALCILCILILPRPPLLVLFLFCILLHLSLHPPSSSSSSFSPSYSSYKFWHKEQIALDKKTTCSIKKEEKGKKETCLIIEKRK